MGVLAITMLLVAPFVLPRHAYGQTPTTTGTANVGAAVSGTATVDPAPAKVKDAINYLDCINPLRPLNGASCAVSVLVVIATSITGIFISLAAWLVQFMLIISFKVADSQTVTRGYDTVLAIANLGFVLGIIIIAIATILRLQSYGAKQLLWKLIVMAIAINFGLVIAKSMINVSNNVAYFLIENTAPAGATGGVLKKADQMGRYVTAMMQGIGPQALFPKDSEQLLKGAAGNQESGNWFIESIKAFIPGSGVVDAAKGLLANTVGDINAFVVSLANGLFVLIFLMLSLVVFLALALMLLLRFIWLTMLLILLPLAWLSWVFPLVSEWWKTWWQKFIRWTFFPPVMLFFVYLALQVQKSSPGNANQNFMVDIIKDGVTSSSGLTEGVVAVFSGSAAIILSNLAQKVVIIGLLIGGFMAANKMSITGAKTALAVGEGIAKNTGTWAKDRVKGAGSRYLTTPKSQSRQWKVPQNRLLAPFVKAANTLWANPFQGVLAPEGAVSAEDAKIMRQRLETLRDRKSQMASALEDEKMALRTAPPGTEEIYKARLAAAETDAKDAANKFEEFKKVTTRAGVWDEEDEKQQEGQKAGRASIHQKELDLKELERERIRLESILKTLTPSTAQYKETQDRLKEISEEARWTQRGIEETTTALRKVEQEIEKRAGERGPRLFESSAFSGEAIKGIGSMVWGSIAKGLEKGMSEEQKKKIFDEGKKLLNSDGIIRSSVDVGLKKLFDSKTKDEKLKHALHEIEELTGVKVKHDDDQGKKDDAHSKPATGGAAPAHTPAAPHH